MNTTKRGLGRGLEALLTEVSTLTKTQETPQEIEAQNAKTVTLIKTLQKDQAELLKEAENLNEFLIDIEATLRRL